jgi:hypothetical protein
MKLLGNVRDVFKKAKHRKPFKVYCPKCASPKIRLSSSLDSWLTPAKYLCPECGYIGIVVMELEEEKTEQEKEEN